MCVRVRVRVHSYACICVRERTYQLDPPALDYTYILNDIVQGSSLCVL